MNYSFKINIWKLVKQLAYVEINLIWITNGLRNANVYLVRNVESTHSECSETPHMMAVRPQGYIRSNISCRYLICSQGSLYETFPTIVNPIIVCRLYIGGYREININYFPLIIARISLKENLGVCKHVFHTFRIKSVFTFNINIWNKYKNQLIIIKIYWLY